MTSVRALVKLLPQPRTAQLPLNMIENSKNANGPKCGLRARYFENFEESCSEVHRPQ